MYSDPQISMIPSECYLNFFTVRELQMPENGYNMILFVPPPFLGQTLANLPQTVLVVIQGYVLSQNGTN